LVEVPRIGADGVVCDHTAGGKGAGFTLDAVDAVHKQQGFIGQANPGGELVYRGIARPHGLSDRATGKMQALLPIHLVVDIGQWLVLDDRNRDCFAG
jgi:hypothetical protein